MHFIPIKTRILQPPQDDLFSVLDESVANLQNGDVVLITSKVVSIHQGRCVPFKDTDKRALVESEAEYWVEGHTHFSKSPLTIKYGALFYGAGIDESNGNGFYVLLPEKPHEMAKEIWQHLKTKHKLNELGVVITDSHSLPLRWGCISVSIGWWGIHALKNYREKTDLFGREMRLSTTNVVDSVVAGATVVTGEGDESTPIVIVRDVPGLKYTDVDTRRDLEVSPTDDLYYPILKPFYEQEWRSNYLALL